LELLSNVIPGRSKVRRHRAIATMAEMIGTLILARAVDDQTLSDEILSATSSNLSEDAPHHPVDCFRRGYDPQLKRNRRK
jgi:hypothetical protein